MNFPPRDPRTSFACRDCGSYAGCLTVLNRRKCQNQYAIKTCEHDIVQHRTAFRVTMITGIHAKIQEGNTPATHKTGRRTFITPIDHTETTTNKEAAALFYGAPAFEPIESDNDSCLHGQRQRISCRGINVQPTARTRRARARRIRTETAPSAPRHGHGSCLTTDPATTFVAESPTQLRIATFNCWTLMGQLGTLIATAKLHNLDVVVLQEVKASSTNIVNYFAFAQSLGWSMVFHPSRYDTSGNITGGLAVLTQWPCDTFSIFNRVPDAHDCMGVRIRRPHGTLLAWKRSSQSKERNTYKRYARWVLPRASLPLGQLGCGR